MPRPPAVADAAARRRAGALAAVVAAGPFSRPAGTAVISSGERVDLGGEALGEGLGMRQERVVA